MDWLRHFDAEKLLLFTLVLTRVSGLLMTAPIYGANDAPMQVRSLLAFTLAVLVTPSQWNVHVADPGTTLSYLVFIGGELLIGVCLGLGIMILFSGIEMAGDLISRAGGLSLSDLFDPTFNADVPLFSRLMLLIATAIFACIGGHRVVMAGLLDTFTAIPPGGCIAGLFATHSATVAGQAGFLASLSETLVTLITQRFELGIRVCMPVVVAALLATIVLGLIGRTLPQLNVIAIGFGLNAMLTFAMMLLSLGAGFLVFQDYLAPALATLLETFKVPLQVQWLPHA
jgi:flagellar biosynthetic protein FliR